MKALTFGSYNLNEGGLDEGRDTRLCRQLAMLARTDADAWALQECKGWASDGYRYLRFAEHALGMRGFLAASGHHGCDVAVFVREASGIRVTGQRHEEGPPYWHAVACVDVLIAGLPYVLASAHLAPSTPALRLIEAEAFALIAERGTLIAGGDWNACPAGGPDVAGHSSAAQERRKRDRSAAVALEEAGLTDVAAHLGNDDPTVGHAGGLAYRCDRIYTSLPPAAITGYRRIAEDRPKSDHLAVTGAFALDASAEMPNNQESLRRTLPLTFNR